MVEQIQILVVDDHPVLRDGLSAVLGTQPDFQVIGEAKSGVEAARKRLERQLERERDLYRWGDLTEGEYKRRRDDIRRQLDALNPVPSGSDNLPRLAQFLADVSSAWESATAEQQNKLARALFEEIWIKDKEVVFVKPRPELDPFFRLNYEESTRKAVEGVTSTRVEWSLFATNCGSPLTRHVMIALGIFYVLALGRGIRTWVKST